MAARVWRRPEAAVAGIWALSFLPFAGTRDLYYEEGRYALAALDMLDHGRWLRPEVLGLGFVDRPPLLLWIVALAVRIGGTSEWAIRAPALLASLAGALLVERAARSRVSGAAGLLAAVAFLLSPYLFTAGARAEPDLFVTVLSFAAFTLWLRVRRTEGAAAALGWCGVALLLSATALLKGPQPLGYFAVGAALVAASERRPRDVGGAALATAAAVCAVVAWGTAVYRPGDEAAWRMVSRTGSLPPAGSYLANVLRFAVETAAHLLPWLAFAALLLFARVRRRAGLDDASGRPFALYALGCTVPLALWPYALPRYAMPALPAVAVLAGIAGASLLRSGPRAARASTIAVVVAAFLARAAWLAAIPFDDRRNEAARRMAAGLSGPLRGTRDAVLVLGPVVDYNAAFYLRLSGIVLREVPSAAQVVPPCWLVTAGPPPPGGREVARVADRRGRPHCLYRYGAEGPPG